MIRKGQINSIFPFCDDEQKDLEPIVFNVPATYGNKVKTHDWQMKGLAEPKDNSEIFPPRGNLHLSSYRRFGPEDAPIGMSETQAMLSQIHSREQYEPIYPQRTLVTLRSFAAADERKEEQDSKLTDVLFDPEVAKRMDYRTTMELHYSSPFPKKFRPPPPPPPPEPWLLNRRTIGYNLCDLEKRDGTHTFLDDDMELHRRIADLKMTRNTSKRTMLDDDSPRSRAANDTKGTVTSPICH